MSDLPPDAIARLQELWGRSVGPEPALPEAPPEIVIPDVTPAAAPAAPPPPKKRARLYDPNRRGFMRATREEGIADELKAMREEARGSPFFDAAPPTPSAGDVARAKLGLKKK